MTGSKAGAKLHVGIIGDLGIAADICAEVLHVGCRCGVNHCAALLATYSRSSAVFAARLLANWLHLSHLCALA